MSDTADLVAIYALKNPLQDLTVFYIGGTATPERRLYEHTNNFMKDGSVNSRKNRIIREIVRAGEAPVMEIIEWVSRDQWRAAEKYWIDYFATFSPQLTNVQRGR